MPVADSPVRSNGNEVPRRIGLPIGLRPGTRDQARLLSFFCPATTGGPCGELVGGWMESTVDS